MGNGAAKNSVKDISGGGEAGGDFDIEGENDEYYARLEEQATAKSTGQKTQLGGLFGAGKKKKEEKQAKAPKIVGLIDSDDEEYSVPRAVAGVAARNARPQVRPEAVGGENNLKEDINDLEKTFGSLGIATIEKRAGKTQTSFSAPSGTIGTAIGVDRNEFLASSSFSNHTRFPPGASAGGTRHNHQFTKPSVAGRRASVVAPGAAALPGGSKLKFSWDQQQGQIGIREAEDWTYKKVSFKLSEKFRFAQ
jgi:hypothetical protein